MLQQLEGNPRYTHGKWIDLDKVDLNKKPPKVEKPKKQTPKHPNSMAGMAQCH